MHEKTEEKGGGEIKRRPFTFFFFCCFTVFHLLTRDMPSVIGVNQTLKERKQKKKKSKKKKAN